MDKIDTATLGPIGTLSRRYTASGALEIMAKALYERHPIFSSGDKIEWDQLPLGVWHSYMDDAKVALGAYRNATADDGK